MSSRFIRWCGFALAAVTFGGCADASGMLSTAPEPAPALSIPPDEEEADPPAPLPTKIKSIWGTVTPRYDSPQVEILGAMLYNAYHARIASRVYVTGPNETEREFFPVEHHTMWSFSDNFFRQVWTTTLGGKCGNHIEAHAEYYVWLIGWAGMALDSDRKTSTFSGSQSACTTPTTASGGGGDRGSGGPGGGGTKCTTVEYQHYWYYLDTGEVEYRYTSVGQYCEYTT